MSQFPSLANPWPEMEAIDELLPNMPYLAPTYPRTSLWAWRP